MHFSSYLGLVSATLVTLAQGTPNPAPAGPNFDRLFAAQEVAAARAGVVQHNTTAEQSAPDHHHDHHHQHAAGGSALRRHAKLIGGEVRGNKGRGMQRVNVKGLRRDQERLRRRQAEGTTSVLDSSDALEARAATQYALQAAATAGAAAAVGATGAVPYAETAAAANVGDGYWFGASSYYLHTLADSERYQVLDALKNSGFKVVRIFIASVGANNKGSNSRAVNDVEGPVGTYDDTILELVDQLMVDCKARGMKLLIALDDRYALGFWSTNSYATSLSIVKAGSSGVQKVANAGAFYTSDWAVTMFDQRLAHIMNHKNQLMGGRAWSQLSDVVYAWEPQNEPQGHMPMASDSWACNRAAYLKTLTSIPISSGGGITTTDSLGPWAMRCPSFDIISVHDYGTSAWTTAGALASAQKQTSKRVIMGEWGTTGANKATLISQFVDAFKQNGIPWMYWEVVKPGKATSDFEVWTDEPAWGALTGQPFDHSPQPVPETSKPAFVAPASSTVAPQQPVTTKAQTAQWSQTTQNWTKSSSSSASAQQQQQQQQKQSSSTAVQQQQTWQQTQATPSPKPTPTTPSWQEEQQRVSKIQNQQQAKASSAQSQDQGQ